MKQIRLFPVDYHVFLLCLDLLFGIPSKYTGINRFYVRSRQRQIAYAITIVLQTYNETFIEGLKQHLLQRYGVGSVQQDETEKEQVVHIYYQVSFLDV